MPPPPPPPPHPPTHTHTCAPVSHPPLPAPVSQQAAYGTASPWNVGVAYRVPDTNINLSVGHQQGRTNFQLSCVPDDSAALLGPNGFTRGVGPGNLGVSVNLSV